MIKYEYKAILLSKWKNKNVLLYHLIKYVTINPRMKNDSLLRLDD